MAIDNIIEEFVDVLKTDSTQPNRTYSAVVSRIDQEGTVWVRVAGSDQETPTASASAEVKRGDSVNVEWRNNKLYIAGNYSNPAAGVDRVAAVESAAARANEAANRAVSDAAIAKVSAEQAVADAETARTAAEQAISDAADAKTAAENAETSAGEAAASASNAATSASSAASSASAAQSDASSASQSASNAGISASNAQAAAEAAQAAALGSITTDTIHYLATDQSSGVTRSTAGWSTTVQAMTSTKRYLWTYHTYTTAGSTSTDTDPVITGVFGEQGAQGIQGPQGEQGERGEQGPQGIQGIQGETGPQGPQGIQGETGEQGPQGETGAQGPKGDTGDTGPQGEQGIQGERGPQGPQGETGETGPQGPKGDKGDTGKSLISITEYYARNNSTTAPADSSFDTTVLAPTASQKYVWNYELMSWDDNGTTSTTKTAKHIVATYGEKGDTGETGPQGETGAKGDTGKSLTAITEYYAINNSTTAPADSSFSTAVKAPTATNKYLWNYEVMTWDDNGTTSTTKTAKHIAAVYGEKGDTGPQGPQGIQGEQGEQGETGATGPQGPQGETGATGPQGPQGIQGETGATGPQGPAGADGNDGHSPVVTATKSGDTTTIKVDGTTVATILDGSDGDAGHSPTITTSKSGTTTTIYADGVAIGTVDDGTDGTTPTITASKTGTTTTVKVNGTTVATINDGANGQDGYSPTARVTKSGDTATITITDKNGTTTQAVTDGADGNDGDDGVSVTAVQPQYYLSTSASSATGGSWSNSLSWQAGRYIWTRDMITYSNSTSAPSTAIYNEALTQSCKDAAEALGLVTELNEYFWHDTNGAHILGHNGTIRNDLKSDGMHIVATATEEDVANFTTTGAFLQGSMAAGNNVEANRYNAFALGDTAKAQGFSSLAAGFGVTASGKCSTVIGRNNEVDAQPENTWGYRKYAFIIGNGSESSSASVKSNALTVDWSGNVVASGDITDGNSNVLSDKADAAALSDYVLKATPYYELDTTAASGTTDGDLYAAIVDLGWDSDVIV